MTSPLTGQTFNDFVDLLKDFCKTEPDRRALIDLAFKGEPIVTDLDYTGSAVTFCSHCGDRLYDYDRGSALIRLLETIRDRKLGPNRKPEADALIYILQGTSDDTEGESKQISTKGQQVFISYSREDHAFVNRLRADLDKHNIPYWIDNVGLVAGTIDWENGLREAIASASGVVLIATPNSRKSLYVRDELAIAKMHNKPLYPVWVDGSEWMDSIPLGWGYVQNIDMRKDAYNTGLSELITVLRRATKQTEESSETRTISVDPQNPYKGLLAFGEQDADRFFGRTALINALIQRIESQLAKSQSRFLAILGPSGAGKSSVAMAGLLPALQGKLVERGINPTSNSDNWIYLPRMVPGTHPLEALADALKAKMPDTPLSSIEIDLNAPGGRMLHRLTRQLSGDYVVLYVDQFEELYTLTTSDRERAQFINLIAQAVNEPDGKLLLILSMRADFLNYPLNDTLLGDLFNNHAEMVRPMTIAELYEAIEQPAQLPSAGLVFDDGLVPEIVFALRGRDKALAGALPLLQFTLERLFEERAGNRLTREAYKRMGGVEGAIGTHSEAIFTQLPESAQAKLGQVFIQLVSVDETSGEPTRRRAPLDVVTADPDAKQLVDAFVSQEARLLQTGSDGDNAYVEVAHEALLRSWRRLVDWIDVTREDQLTIRRIEREAGIWKERGEPEHMLPNAEEIGEFNAACERLGRKINDPMLQAFIEPEQERLYRELQVIETTHQRRYDIGERLARIGDTREGIGIKDGLPDILWLPVKGSNGAHKFEFGEFEVKPFFIAKYPTTLVQVQVFLDSDWDNPRWWEGFPDDYQPQNFRNVTNGNANAPRDTISWYQSVAFGRWMAAQFEGLALEHPSGAILRVGDNAEIRLPTEWEWQWAAMAGAEERKYPWGEWDEHPRANTTEAGIQDRSTAVGMYPHGVAECGALDMAGNLYEWCLNESKPPEEMQVDDSVNSRVRRGGLFSSLRYYAAAASRYGYGYPNLDDDYAGCRLVVCLRPV